MHAGPDGPGQGDRHRSLAAHHPQTPPAWKQLDAFGRIDVLLLGHGHFDHSADAAALAQQDNVPLRAPGDLNRTLTTLGVLPATLLPRMNKGGTIEPAPGIKVSAVRAEHSSVYVWRNPTSAKDETHPGANRSAGSSSSRTAAASTPPATLRPSAT